MARRAVLHSALFKNGLSKGSESAPGRKVTPRCPQPLALESSPTRACRVLGFTVLSLNPRAANKADTLRVPGTDHTEAIKLQRVG